MRRLRAMLSVVLAVIIPGIAAAAPIILDFNAIGTGTNAKVQTYLNTVAGPGAITVRGAVANKSYTGDGYAFRDSYGNYRTLGRSEYVNGVYVPNTTNPRRPVYDTFLYNVGGHNLPKSPYGTAGADKIVFDFTMAIYAIEFDWQIFPNSDCQRPGQWNGCGPGFSDSAMPDFSLWAGTATTRLYDWHTGDGLGSFPLVTNANNDYPQGIGHFSATFATPVTHIEFVDWPVRIGIDNLSLTTTRLPEPGTLALLAGPVLGFALARRSRRG